MTETNGMRDESVVRYDDRQPVRGRALLPAIAAGLGVGLAVFYIRAPARRARAPLALEPPNAAVRDTALARSRG